MPEPSDPSAASLSSAFQRLIEAAVSTAQRLGLRELPAPSGLAKIAGNWRGAAVELRLRLFSGEGFEKFWVAEVSGEAVGWVSATVIGIPTPTGGPILGIDAVAQGLRLPLLAVDLAPVDLKVWEARARPALESLGEKLRPHTKSRKLPDFAEGSFSKAAVIVAAEPGAEGVALEAATGFLLELPTIDGSSTTSNHAYSDRIRAWKAAERRNRKEQRALASLFGEAAAESLTEALFSP